MTVFSSRAKLWTRIGTFLGIAVFALAFIGIFVPVDKGSSQETVFSIERGQGSREIGYNLQTQGLIRLSPLFRIYAVTTGASFKLQAGDYLLSPSLSMADMMRKFTTGDVIQEKLTIVEGWNLRDIGWHLEGRGMFMAEELFELVGFPAIDYRKSNDLPPLKDFSAEYSFLKDKPDFVGLEGYLFPDTYLVRRGETLEEIVGKALSHFAKKFDQRLITETARQKKTIFSVVTMASLLEKEVRTLQDKRIVAGVLWKRLSAGMALQVDATVAYLTGEKTTQISREETQIDSRFNTYKYPGLPAGPIANPGLDSLEAALYAQDSQFWYYLSTPEGTTIFSKTLEEHNIAKAKYLKN